MPVEEDEIPFIPGYRKDCPCGSCGDFREERQVEAERRRRRERRRVDDAVSYAEFNDYSKTSKRFDPKKESSQDMDSSEIRTVDNEVAKVLRERRIERLREQKLAAIDAYGEDTFEAGTVLRFVRKFNETGPGYTYAVIKVDNGRWYTTANSDNGVYNTWEDLVLWLLSGEFPVTSLEVLAVERQHPAQAASAPATPSKTSTES
jgi:hypothetical protein